MCKLGLDPKPILAFFGFIINSSIYILINSNRDGLQIPRGEEETIIRPRLVAISEYPECTSAAHRSASCCRSLALTVSLADSNPFLPYL